MPFPHSWLIIDLPQCVVRQLPVVEQQLFTLSEHINSTLFYRGWCRSIFSFLCSALWFIVCPFVNFHCVCLSILDLRLLITLGILKLFILMIKKGISYKQVKTRFKDMDISQNIYNCCIDQSTFLMSDIYCEDHLLN
jgi:hypothetical protein